ncbi:hypothetical protein [Longimicrobium sp.]|uniref:hypothetical protein n=1 Tax=Longimicrobium sp. TaxID=2029185 RepID=UPI002E314E59|nr:hypothetical protein [Longimicrobium sp.]HEX6040529.1 hypothetical protein [Longimicrobium sp.]
MRVSAEVRWFWRDEPPGGLEAWFRDADAHGCPAGDEEARADVYLRDPGQTELGIKRRGGNEEVEVKALVSVIRDGVAAPPFVGPAETWTKVRARGLDFAASVTTHKARRLRTFETGGAEPVEMRPGSPAPPVGCNVELTRVTVNGDVWWTLGFESFGPPRTLTDSLRATTALLATRRPPRLGDGLQASYPAWLAQLGPAFHVPL